MDLLPRGPGAGADPLEELLAFSGGRVRFRVHPGEFGLDVRACGNPECDCEEALLVFADLSAPRGEGLAFAVQVRLPDASVVAEKSQVPPGAEPLVEEALRELVPAVRDGLLERMRTFRDPSPRVGRLRLAPDWLQGGADLLPLAHILAGGRPEDPSYRGHFDRRELDGATWLVQDLCCPRAACDCRELVLDFQRVPDTDHGPAVFGARIALGDLSVSVEQPLDLGLREARAVVAAWFRRSPKADRRVLTARYRALRELAARPLGGSEPPEPAARPARVPGGKEPCPCGSGKKYKRCCGALEN